jgi:phage/plasmid-like protein (TIGR03299 family)
LGTVVSETQNSLEALKLAQLDWDVVPEPIYLKGMKEPIEERVANVRSTDRKVLGVVSDHYKILQNREAFSFIDDLLENDIAPVKFESAGSLDNGKRIWMLAHFPERMILGDTIIPYIVLATSHNGTLATTVAVTPTRVVCQNTLTMALKNAQRTWSIRHMGDIVGKKQDAARTLKLSASYMDKLEVTAEQYQQKKITKKMLNDIIETVFPIDEEDSERVKNNVSELRNQFFDIYSGAADLKKFSGDAWGLYNAFGDFASHIKPARVTKKYQESLFKSFMDGNKILERAQEAIEEAIA